MNGSTTKITVLYKIANSECDTNSYNAFDIPRVDVVKLATVKQHCLALRHLSHLGADGYHWRIRIDEKCDTIKTPNFNWVDIINKNARLPLRKATLTEINRMLDIPKICSASADDSVTAVTKGAIRSFGKAINKVAGTVEGSSSSQVDNGPCALFMIFKLLDMNKVAMKYRGDDAIMNRFKQTQSATGSVPIHLKVPAIQKKKYASSSALKEKRSNPQVQLSVKPIPQTQGQESSLMDFGPSTTPQCLTGLTRAQKLKLEYEKKKSTDNRVWDEVDQRWNTIDATTGFPPKSTTSVPSRIYASSYSKDEVKGISLESSNAVGKSVTVAAAVHTRVNDLKECQKKAVDEIRRREITKKESEASEDAVRLRLEPKVKEWCEEHGKKKQLRALLSSLHTILWAEAKWKPVNLGDILDEKKCRLCFHKASRVVHPDKTMNLSPVNRFLAKRIFDAICQAKVDFDDDKK